MDVLTAYWASATLRVLSCLHPLLPRQGLLLLEEERLQARARLGLPPKASPWPVPSREDLPEGLSIFRLYWALVHGTFKAGQRGSITLPVPLPAGGGPARPAITLYRVLAASAGLSWVELVPLTGKKSYINLRTLRCNRLHFTDWKHKVLHYTACRETTPAQVSLWQSTGSNCW